MHDRIFHWVIIFLAIAKTALLAGCGSAVPSALPSPNLAETVIDDSVVADELIVAARPGADSNDLHVLFDDSGATIRAEIEPLSTYLLGVEPSLRENVAISLEASPLIEDVLDNHWYEAQATPNDLLYQVQWHLETIGASAAWDLTTGSNQVLVAVLDTGVDTHHDDLSGKLTPGADTFNGGSDCLDVCGHGTAVAGIIGASANNNIGITSIAWENPILPVRVTDEQGRSTSWSIASGIGLAIMEGAKVINISFAPLQNDDIVLRQARRAWLAGALVVISSGNTGVEVLEGGSEWALFVGAVDQTDQLSQFSTYGPWLDLVAPGVGIYSTKLGNDYASESGTSFAAPAVSGVAALIWSLRPELRPITVEQLLKGTAKDLGLTGFDNIYGAGRVDAEAALRYTNYMVEQADETAPAISILTPTNGASLNTRTKVDVSASDNIDVADVTIFIDNLVRASDPIIPYAFALDPQKYAAGQHELKAVATDTSGNSTEQTIVLFFAGPADADHPTVTILSPKEDTTVRGVVTVLADVADTQGLSRVEVLVDNAIVTTIPLAGNESRIAYNWTITSTEVAASSHTLTVRVYDTSGNTASESVHVTFVK